MAIAKMLKMRLISIDGKQDDILNALHSTGFVQLDNGQRQFDGLKTIQCDKSDVKDKRERVEQALSIITKYAKEVMKLALDFVRTYPCGKAEYCWLSYDINNEAARNLYRSFGFEEVPSAYYEGGEMPAILKL